METLLTDIREERRLKLTPALALVSQYLVVVVVGRRRRRWGLIYVTILMF